MKNLILAAFAALSLTTAAANAAVLGATGAMHQTGPYDNTGAGPDETGLEGGGG